jgi:hypothetical protein
MKGVVSGSHLWLKGGARGKETDYSRPNIKKTDEEGKKNVT